jgi:spermidine synthase
MGSSEKKPLQAFLYASDNFHPVEEFDREKALKSKINFHYYNSEIHCASFFLPSFMRKNLTASKASNLAESVEDTSLSDLSI